MNYQTELTKDIVLRKQRLQQQMQELAADACLLSTGVNIFYMTGMLYAGYYYLSAEGDVINFVKRSGDANPENAVQIRKPEQITDVLKDKGLPLPKTVLLEMDVLSYNHIMRLISALNIESILNASTLLRRIRSVKSDFEIAQTKICASKHIEVYKLVPSLYQKGMTDVEMQVEIERQMRLHGSMGIFRSYGENMDIYMGSLLVGVNAEASTPFDYALGGAGTSPTLPIGASGITIEDGNSIMVDMAGNYSPWMTDITRVFAVGRLTDLAYKAHQVSIDIHNVIKGYAKAGTACADLYNTALEMAKQNGLSDYFMGTRQQAGFVGHGVGLEINEVPVLAPRSKEILEQNVVFALEPKFVIPNVGAVGIENTYLVTESGLENLTVLEENIIEL